MEEEPTGAVLAFKTEDGKWSPCPVCLADQGKAFGIEVRTISVA